jgi:suppressor for copper-sensitivity B
MSPLKRLAQLYILCLFALFGHSAWAAGSDWAKTEQGEVRLIAATRAVGDESTLRLGLHFRMKKDWKIYWRSPGDAGYPPKPDWQGSTNLAKTEIQWPIPIRFSVTGLETIGYEGEVVLPILAQLEKPGLPLAIKLNLDFLACEKICIPINLDLALNLPSGKAESTPEAHLIERFIARVPSPRTAHGLALLSSQIIGQGKAAFLRVEAQAEPPFQKPDIFVEGPETASFDAPKIKLSEGGKKALLSLSGQGIDGLLEKKLTLTLADGERALESEATPAKGQESGGAAFLLIMLATAFLGGLILNLMPCVLPVLSIKIIGLIGHSGAERREIRLGFLASAGGVVASFLGLAIIAIFLKSAGSAVGWGIQFQQPLFLSTMIILLTLFAANLWGFFEFHLPQWLGGMGKGYGHPHSPLGHFLSGVFATLLATPCSAPFLGTAVGFALSRGTLEILAIFLMLGLGMALPYIAIAIWPRLAMRLPRPGKWMLGLKIILGLALAGTAIWLIFVLAAQTGWQAGLMAFIVLALAIIIIAWGKSWRWLVATPLAILAFFAPLLLESPQEKASAKSDSAEIWHPFEPDRISALVAEGKTVLIDVTADWCITCKVNKALALDDARVVARLKKGDIVAMRADWTKPEPKIAAYLQSFSRYGIPFNAAYGPGAPDGLALPELLTPSLVLEYLDKAGKK